MKKLMFILAAILAVGMAQGAVVNWKVSNVRAPTADALTIGASNAKITTSDTALVLNLYLVPAGSEKELLKGNIALTGDATVAQAQLWSQTEAVDMRSTKYNAAGVGYVDLLLEMTYEDAENTYSASITKQMDLRNIESVASSAAFSFAGVTFTATPKDIPEPTSGLLLIVGGAMLALRRRRA